MADSPIRVEGGTPTPTELAAVLLVLLAARKSPQEPAPTAPPRADWGPARGWRPPGTWPAAR